MQQQHSTREQQAVQNQEVIKGGGHLIQIELNDKSATSALRSAPYRSALTSDSHHDVPSTVTK